MHRQMLVQRPQTEQFEAIGPKVKQFQQGDGVVGEAVWWVPKYMCSMIVYVYANFGD